MTRACATPSRPRWRLEESVPTEVGIRRKENPAEAGFSCAAGWTQCVHCGIGIASTGIGELASSWPGRACCADRSRSGSCGAASTHRGPASTRPRRCHAGRRPPAAARGYPPAAGPAGRCGPCPPRCGGSATAECHRPGRIHRVRCAGRRTAVPRSANAASPTHPGSGRSLHCGAAPSPCWPDRTGHRCPACCSSESGRGCPGIGTAVLQQLVGDGHRCPQVAEEVADAGAGEARHYVGIGRGQRTGNAAVDRVVELVHLAVERFPWVVGCRTAGVAAAAIEGIEVVITTGAVAAAALAASVSAPRAGTEGGVAGAGAATTAAAGAASIVAVSAVGAEASATVLAGTTVLAAGASLRAGLPAQAVSAAARTIKESAYDVHVSSQQK